MSHLSKKHWPFGTVQNIHGIINAKFVALFTKEQQPSW